VFIFLKRGLGHCKAFELRLSEKEIGVKNALEFGVVNKVVPLHLLKQTTFQVAEKLTKKPNDSLITYIRRPGFGGLSGIREP
jgi:enoyl-CoA hydratase/carnithine racemase